LVVGARRILARLHHPDCGGTDAEMITINNAYDAIVEARR
jgi:hypothetical protein